MNIYQRFGDRVSARRRQLGLKQADLAAKVEMSVDMISRIEIAKTGVTFATIEKLAAALEVDPGSLFYAGNDVIADSSPEYQDLIARLAKLNPADLRWIAGVITATLASRGK